MANVIELFERFAYYGSKAILAVYIADQVGLGPEAAGFLAGSVFNTLLYFLPVLAGTVVDRYGFKRSLLACFSIFTVGYFMIGLAGLPLGQPIVAVVGAKAWMLLALVVTAIGGSLIKPSIVGTVARTTTKETASLGYSIYYTLVNIGGAVGPMLALAGAPQPRHLLRARDVLAHEPRRSCSARCSSTRSRRRRPTRRRPARWRRCCGTCCTVFRTAAS